MYVLRYTLRNTGQRPRFVSVHGLPRDVRAALEELSRPLDSGEEAARVTESEAFPFAGWLPAVVGADQ